MIRKKKKVVKKERKLVNDCPSCDYTYRCYGGVVSKEAVKLSCPTCKVKNAVQVPDEESEAEEPEVCPIRFPRQRKSEGLDRYYALVGKPPLTLPDAKWKTVREWAEGTRDIFQEEESKFVTVSALIGLLFRLDIPKGRRKKAERRLKILYAEEHNLERAVTRSLMAQASRKDPWGNEPTPNVAPAKGPVKEHASGKKATEKKPGIITRIVELLRKADPMKPITKDQIHADLVKSFPERDPDAMRNTINSQIPSCLKKEKGLEVQHNFKGYWLED